MTLKEFREWEALCKRAWEHLAKTGDSQKPDFVDSFLHQCPACEIAARAAKSEFKDCRYCPILAWRRKALHPANKHYVTDQGQPICERIKDLYGIWVRNSRDNQIRKKAAAEIASLEWKFLPVYEEISGEMPKGEG